MNGSAFTAPEEVATQAVVELDAGTLADEAFAAWLKDNVKKMRRKRK